MKKPLFLTILLLTGQQLLFAVDKGPKKMEEKPKLKIEITFDEHGKLVSLLPNTLKTGDVVVIKRTGKALVDQQVQLLKHYKKLVTALDTVTKSASTIGMAPSHSLLTAIKCELAKDIDAAKSKRLDLVSGTEQDMLDRITRDCKSSALFPDIEDLGLTQEQITIKYYYKNGKTEIKTVERDNEFTIEGEDIIRIEIDVSKPNIYKDIERNLIGDGSAVQDLLNKLLEFKITLEDRYPATSPFTQSSEDSVLDAMKSFTPAIEKFLAYYTWRIYSDIGPTGTSYEDQKTAMETAIRNKEKEIQLLLTKLQVDSVQIFSHATASGKGGNCSDLDCLLKLYGQLGTKVATGKENLLKAREELTQLKKSLSDLIASNQRGTSAFFDLAVLNRLKLFITDNTKQQVMIHYNADEDFEQWSEKRPVTITEEEQMLILAHNLTTDQHIKLTQTVTPVTDDLSSGEDIFDAAGLVAKNTALQATLATLFDGVGLKRILEVLREYGKIGSLPFRTAKPSFESKILKTNAGGVIAPFVVNYNISLLKKDGTDSVKVFPADQAFRVNKKYYVRFKAGILYSRLRQDNYTLSNNQITARTSNEFGAEACFGAQLFPGGIDIRSNKFLAKSYNTCPFFLYFGTVVTSNPLQNLLFGAGCEIYSGFAMMAGLHVGKFSES